MIKFIDKKLDYAVEPIYTHDFGVIDSGAIVEHTFKIENKADVPIKPIATTASCACVSVRVKSEPILPGETCEVFVKMQGKSSSGPSSHIVSIQFDKEDVKCKLHINALCRFPVASSIKSFSVDLPTGEANSNSSFYLLHYTSDDACSLEATCKDDLLQILSMDRLESDEATKWKCNFLIKSAFMPTGVHRSIIEIKPSNGNVALAVPVSVMITPSM